MKPRADFGLFAGATAQGVAVLVMAAMSTAQAVPRSCVHYLDDPSGGLKPGDGVVHRLIRFDWSGFSVPVEVFSTQAKSGSLPDERCIRWEALNTSSTWIDHFQWPAGRTKATLFGPGDRLSMIDRGHFAAEVRDGPIRAFERQEKTTQAWTDSETIRGMEPRPTVGSLRYETPDNAIDLPSEEGAGVLVEIGDVLSPLSTTVGGSGFQIEFVSGGHRSPTGLTLVNSADASGEHVTSAYFEFPFLMASERHIPASVAVEWVRAGELEENILAEFADPLKYESEWRFASDLHVGAGESITLFRTLHPVSIHYGEGEAACFLVSAYSPLPLQFTLDDCLN